MGGRGASSGISKKGKKYGTEYETLYKDGNIKFVRYKGGSAKTPMETMTRGRIYGTINGKGTLKSLTYYDNSNKRSKQIDLEGIAHKINGVATLPHVHKGYIHDELGTRGLSKKEMNIVVRAINSWYNRGKK